MCLRWIVRVVEEGFCLWVSGLFEHEWIGTCLLQWFRLAGWCFVLRRFCCLRVGMVMFLRL